MGGERGGKQMSNRRWGYSADFWPLCSSMPLSSTPQLMHDGCPASTAILVSLLCSDGSILHLHSGSRASCNSTSLACTVMKRSPGRAPFLPSPPFPLTWRVTPESTPADRMKEMTMHLHRKYEDPADGEKFIRLNNPFAALHSVREKDRWYSSIGTGQKLDRG